MKYLAQISIKVAVISEELTVCQLKGWVNSIIINYLDLCG